MNLKYMDKNTTLALKGIALICMFVHHFFTFPDWHVHGHIYAGLTSFANDFCVPLKICVPVLAFLTGYFYAGHKGRTYRYSLRKISDLYVSYWMIYIPLLVLAIVLNRCPFYVSGFVYEMLAVKTDIMIFCWYVYFYAVAMLLLPLLTKSDTYSPIEDIFLLLVLPTAVTSVVAQIYYEGMIHQFATDIRDWFPSIASGYLCAKYGLFEKLFDRGVMRFRSGALHLIIWAGMVLLAFLGRYYCQYLHLGGIEIRGGVYEILYTMDVFYAPLFVYGMANLLQFISRTWMMKPLILLGKQSMLMWFLHCVFFNVFREITQPILYFPQNPVLVVLFGLLLCYLLAAVVDPVLKRILKEKNRIFHL